MLYLIAFRGSIKCSVSDKTLSLWYTTSYKKFDWSLVWLQFV